MNTIFNTLFKIRLNTISIKTYVSFPRILLNKFPKKNKFYENHRHFSSQEAFVQEFQKKLSENKHSNILIYSSTKKGRVLVNVICLIIGSLISYFSLPLWSFLNSYEFRTTSDSPGEKALDKTDTKDIFKYSICGIIGFFGKYLNF